MVEKERAREKEIFFFSSSSSLLFSVSIRAGFYVRFHLRPAAAEADGAERAGRLFVSRPPIGRISFWVTKLAKVWLFGRLFKSLRLHFWATIGRTVGQLELFSKLIMF